MANEFSFTVSFYRILLKRVKVASIDSLGLNAPLDATHGSIVDQRDIVVAGKEISLIRIRRVNIHPSDRSLLRRPAAPFPVG